MKLCIKNKNLFRSELPNEDLFKNVNINKMFDVKNTAFNNKDNLKTLITKR